MSQVTGMTEKQRLSEYQSQSQNSQAFSKGNKLITQSTFHRNFRNKGKNVEHGKLVKGLVNDASKKQFISSIPTKNEQIIIELSEKKQGFGNGAQRFNNQSWMKYDITPGDQKPSVGTYNQSSQFLNKSIVTNNLNNSISHALGSNNSTMINNTLNFNNQSSINDGSYQHNLSTTQINDHNASSLLLENYYQNTKKKPYQQFADRQSQSVQSLKSLGPGPGAYSLQNDKQQKLIERSQNNKGSAPFIKNIQKIPALKPSPGPQEYDINSKNFKKNNNTFKSSFISQSVRGDFKNNKIPGAGEYNLAGDLVQKKPYKHVGESSNFQMPQKQNIITNPKLHVIKSLLKDKKFSNMSVISPIYEEKRSPPGPGSYDIQKPLNIYPEYVHNSLSSGFVEGRKNRFGQDYFPTDPIIAQNKNISPGPGAYDNQKYGLDQVAQKKAFVSQSSFISETKRQPYKDYSKKIGPSIDLNLQNINKKKNFNLNMDQKWI